MAMTDSQRDPLNLWLMKNELDVNGSIMKASFSKLRFLKGFGQENIYAKYQN